MPEIKIMEEVVFFFRTCILIFLGLDSVITFSLVGVIWLIQF